MRQGGLILSAIRRLWSRELLWPALLCGAGLVAVTLHGYRAAGEFSVKLELTSTAPGIAQLYFDRGQGYSEVNSASTGYLGNGKPELLKFPARRGRFSALRFDPSQGPGAFSISNAEIVDRYDTVVLRFPPAEMRPHQQIAEWSVMGGRVDFSTAPSAADPVISLSERPFALRPTVSTLLRHAWMQYLAVLFGGLLLYLAMQRFRSRLDAVLSDHRTCVALSAALPLAVYADLLFFGRTLTFDTVSGHGTVQGKSKPVADPLAGTAQDHPWLNFIGRSLRDGELPLVNLQNGLGAPLLESLQPGVFYPLNLLLPLFNLQGPWFFGAFMLLHVILLWAGVTLLLRLYVPVAPAAVLSAAFTLSPLTFSAINMVHYRAFAWVPITAWVLVNLARGRIEPRVVAIGVGSIAMSFAAGNPQETLLGLLACALLFTIELAVRDRWPMFKPALFAALVIFSGVMLGLPAVLPYMEARSAGALVSVEDSGRALVSNDLQWLSAWIVPAFQGVNPHFFQRALSHDEFSTFSFAPASLFLILAGFVTIRHGTRLLPRQVAAFSILGVAIVIGMMKVFGFRPLNALASYLPFFESVRYTKYVNYIHLLGVVAAAMALANILAMDPARRRRVLVGASACFSALVALAGVSAALSSAWQFSFAALKVAIWIWIGALLSVAALTAVLLRHESRTRWITLAMLVGVSALLMRPYGFPRSIDRPSPLLEAPGWAEEQQNGRILALDLANVNLLRPYESIGVFDPVLNAALARFMTENFDTFYPRLWPQPKPERALSDRELDALRLLGVTSIVDYRVSSAAVVKVTDRWWRIDRPLPRIFLVHDDAAEHVANACAARDHTAALLRIEQGLIARVAMLKKGVNQIVFTLDRGGRGTLVVLQAFTPAWRLLDEKPYEFCRIFPAWRGSFDGGRRYVIEYQALGLVRGLWLGLVGALLAALACILAARYRSIDRDVQTISPDWRG
jgi:hypothetical protein